MLFRVLAVLTAVVVVAAFAWAVEQEQGDTPPGNAATFAAPVAPASSASGASQTVTVRSANPRIYFVGDSLSVNWLASSPSAGFRETLTRKLHGRQSALVAANGLTVGQALSVMPSEPTRDSDLLVIELGTNDLVRQVGQDESTTAFRQLVPLARQHAPGSALLCMGPWNSGSVGTALKASMTATCTAAGGVYVDVSDIFERGDTRGPAGTSSYLRARDGFHPNDLGHRLIADRLASAVRT